MARLTRGERFKDARVVYNVHKKQTMDEVAAATGVSKSLIQSLEDDSVNRSVGYDKVAKLAAHYRVTTDFLLGLTDDPFPVPSVVDDLGLSLKAVDTIERLEMFDTPTGQLQFRNASNHALDILNCLLESPNFHEVMENLLMCFDSFWVNANGRHFVCDDYGLEAEMRDAGHIVLKGDYAARFYANEAGNSLRELVCKEVPILVASCIKDK
ncbi:MAG: helix-turn-helix transcriptional regulator [Ruminococcaceae bacterium]|nr:helix-turn-helix transcriptional regulator [Oscillospiraceae bacterium]